MTTPRQETIFVPGSGEKLDAVAVSQEDGPEWGDLKPAHPNYRRQQQDDLEKFLLEQVEIDTVRDTPAPVEAKETGRRRIKAGKRVLRPAGEPASSASPYGGQRPMADPLDASKAPAYGIQSRLWLDRRQRLLEQALVNRRRDDEEALIMILLTLD